MIHFKSLTWKNLLSTGNQPTTIRLDSSPTTLVLGANGSGKSTMLDALCYALFKKPFRKIKKDQIVNTINKSDCVIEVEFSIGQHEYTVRRGIKPDFFEIVIDGELRQKAAGQKDDQAFLEEDILKVNKESFTQVVILGNAAYTPFMQLKTPERRDFIEHILDIGVFSVMNDLLKTKQTGVKGSLETLAKEINVHREKLTLVESFIEKLEAERKKATSNTLNEIEEQNAIIDEHTPFISQLQQEIADLNLRMTNASQEINRQNNALVDARAVATEAEVAALEDTIVDFANLENKVRGFAPTKFGIEKNLKDVQASIAFYTDNDACKTCKQTIEESFRNTILDDKQKKIAEYQNGLSIIDKTVDKINAQIAEHKENNRKIKEQIVQIQNEHNKEVRRLNQEAQEKIKTVTANLRQSVAEKSETLQTHQSAVAAARQLVKKLEADMKAAQNSANLEEQILKRGQIERTLAAKEKERDETIELRHFYEVAGVLLKDTGIKAAIIKQYLPMINKLVNKYLTEFDFFLLFALDENFDETFKSRHRDTLQYHSFSEGEKLRIDLALLFAWRDIARMKNSCATNLLILDEVIDGSMDNNGTDFFIKMINELGEGSNVFVISHKQDSSLDKFRSVLRFIKDKNFSKLAESN